MPRRMISVMRHFPLICIDYHYIVVMKQLCRKKFLEVSCLGFICFSKEVFFPSLQSIYHCAHRKQFCQNIFCRRVLLFFNITSLYFSLTLPVSASFTICKISLSCLLRNNFFPTYFLSSQGTSLNRIHNPSFNSHSSFFANNIFGNKAHDDGVKNIYFIF